MYYYYLIGSLLLWNYPIKLKFKIQIQSSNKTKPNHNLPNQNCTMSDILNNFISQHIGTSSKPNVTTCVTVPSNLCGSLAITGSYEWNENLSNLEKSPNSLEEPHIIPCSFRTKHIFTSSSSLHTFILDENDVLYSFGKQFVYALSIW